MNFPAAKGASLEPFVATAQIQLLSRAVKVGWADDSTRTTGRGRDHGLSEAALGGALPSRLKIFHQLVFEMNQQTPGTPLVSQRKIAVSFRHNALLSLFRVALQGLQGLQSENPDRAHKPKLKEAATALTLACLSYDFVGTLSGRVRRGHRDDPGAFVVALAHRGARYDGAAVRRVQIERAAVQ